MPTTTVIFFTYASDPGSARAEYADQCLRSLLKNLRFDGTLRFHIADDGSYQGHRDHLAALVEVAGFEVTVTNSERHGYGGSYNAATQVVHPFSDFILACEDDWLLTRELALSPLAAALADLDGPMCIRLGYLGWTQELKGKLIQSAEQTFLLFDPETAEPHVFAGHPRMETVLFEIRVGEWPEEIDAGTTEYLIAKRQEAREGVAWPLDLGIPASQAHDSLFAHIGSVQAREDQLPH